MKFYPQIFFSTIRSLLKILSKNKLDKNLILLAKKNGFSDKKISDLTMPKGVVIGGVVRNNELILTDENTILQVKDKLIIFSIPSSIKDIEKYSEVNIEFF